MHNAKPGRRKTLLQKPAQPPREAQQQLLQESGSDVPCAARGSHVGAPSLQTGKRFRIFLCQSCSVYRGRAAPSVCPVPALWAAGLGRLLVFELGQDGKRRVCAERRGPLTACALSCMAQD